MAERFLYLPAIAFAAGVVAAVNTAGSGRRSAACAGVAQADRDCLRGARGVRNRLAGRSFGGDGGSRGVARAKSHKLLALRCRGDPRPQSRS
jgi:hypothetical protein